MIWLYGLDAFDALLLEAKHLPFALIVQTSNRDDARALHLDVVAKVKRALFLGQDKAFFLSRAYRDGFAVLGVSHQPFGVDIERIGCNSDIPWQVLHENEVSYLKGLEPQQREVQFATLWAVGEAYVKACNAGLFMERSGFCVRIGDDIRIEQRLDAKVSTYFFATLDLDFVLAAVFL